MFNNKHPRFFMALRSWLASCIHDPSVPRKSKIIPTVFTFCLFLSNKCLYEHTYFWLSCCAAQKVSKPFRKSFLWPADTLFLCASRLDKVVVCFSVHRAIASSWKHLVISSQVNQENTTTKKTTTTKNKQFNSQNLVKIFFTEIAIHAQVKCKFFRFFVGCVVYKTKQKSKQKKNRW